MKTVIVYGSHTAQAVAKKRNRDAAAIAPAAASGRAGFMAKQKSVGTADLVGAIDEKKVALEKIAKDQLPDVLKGKTLEQQKEIIKKHAQQRKLIQAEIKKLNKQRNDYIRSEKKKRKIKSEFDETVLKGLKKQADKAGIKY